MGFPQPKREGSGLRENGPTPCHECGHRCRVKMMDVNNRPICLACSNGGGCTIGCCHPKEFARLATDSA